MQRIGPAQRDIGTQVVSRHRQSDLVDIAAEHEIRGMPQGGEFGADGAGRVVHPLPGEPTCPVPGHHGRRRLLQRFVGEQPTRHIQPGELRGGFAAQPRGLDQRGGVVAVPVPDRGDVGHQAGVGEPQLRDLGQCGRPGGAGQVGDVLPAHRQEGLTPVIMTL